MQGRKIKSIPNMPRPKMGRALIVMFTLVVSVMLTVGLSGGQLLDFGRSMAMLSVGIMQPQGGAEALSERLERIPASQNKNGQKDSVATPTKPYITGSFDQFIDLTQVATEVIPEQAGDGGTVLEEQLTNGSNFVEGVAIKNASSQTINIAEQIAIAPNLGLTNTADPQVLIMHTHTTEAYMTYFAGYFNASDPARSQDVNRSVVIVGESIAAQLRAAGIGVIHDATIHDSPKYTGAYDRSAETVKKALEQYPTIRVVLDIHRDSMNRSGSEKLKPTVEINGRKAAQMMIITSVCDSASIPHPNWPENLRFALRLQSSLNTQYEGIVRPLYLVDSRYNEHLTNGSLLIEIGSEANTVSEAVYSGQILGKTLSQVLGSLI